MRATVTMRKNDDATLTSAAHALRTIEGIEAVTADESRSLLVVDYDGEAIDEGEILNRIASEGIEEVELLSRDDT